MSQGNLKVFDPSELPVARKTFEETPLYNKIDISSIIFRQIERTNMSALQGEEFFASNVRLLMSHVPSHKRDEILARNDEFTSMTERLEYKQWCGVPIGTPEHPINGSPFPIKEEVIDWHKLFEITLDVLEECGITWKFENWTVEMGAVKKKKKEIPPPTPLLHRENMSTEDKKEKLTPQVGRKENTNSRRRRCAICNKPIDPGTGTTEPTGEFKDNGKPIKKLVHTELCLELARRQWKNK